ncbi:hypothetical protein [Duncaniella freteri]|jgi:hypothetical protein|uniref:hypothetical protein n=1 Tax=Duncaniella freteri TaxID=2530391 RepID=UPI003F671993
MAKEKKNAEAVAETQAAPAIELVGNVNVPLEIREEIVKKAEALKAEHKLRKVFVIIVEGEEGDDKPLYIAYMRRPGLMHFSQYMNFAQKDVVQANKMLATNIFLAGDREMVDDEDLFLYGTMGQLSQIIDSRNADMVKK